MDLLMSYLLKNHFQQTQKLQFNINEHQIWRINRLWCLNFFQNMFCISTLTSHIFFSIRSFSIVRGLKKLEKRKQLKHFHKLEEKIEKKMEPLSTTKQVLIWLSLHPVNDSTIPKWTRIGRCILPLSLIILIMCAITVSLSFIIKFYSTNVEATIFTIVVFVVYTGLFYIMIIAFFSRYRITKLLGQLAKIYDTSLYFYKLLLIERILLIFSI